MYALLAKQGLEARQPGPATTEYLYDSHGVWIAFRRTRNDKYVFAPNGEWIGWLPWDEKTVVNTKGEYLGTIFPNGRLYQLRRIRHRARPPAPIRPVIPGRPPNPPRRGYVSLPVMVRNLSRQTHH